MQTKLTKKQKLMLERNKQIASKYKELRTQKYNRKAAADLIAEEHELTNSTVQRILYDPYYPINKKDLKPQPLKTN